MVIIFSFTFIYYKSILLAHLSFFHFWNDNGVVQNHYHIVFSSLSQHCILFCFRVLYLYLSLFEVFIQWEMGIVRVSWAFYVLLCGKFNREKNTCALVPCYSIFKFLFCGWTFLSWDMLSMSLWINYVGPHIPCPVRIKSTNCQLFYNFTIFPLKYFWKDRVTGFFLILSLLH